MKPLILLVEDEDRFRKVLQLDLEAAGYTVETAGSAEEALPLAPRATVVVTDLRLPGMDGVELLERLRAQNAEAPIILMTAYGTVERAVEAMKLGAIDFLTKPFPVAQLREVVRRAVESRMGLPSESSGTPEAFAQVIGRSPQIREVLATVERVAATKATVLIVGESGTGKDVIARAIHRLSPRRNRPFVKINCATIPENLMESELFGFEKGAFTGAVQSRAGKFEEADTGTAFLDEIGEVPLAIQVKLLRVLQERAFERLGSNRTRTVDVRVIAATNRDLAAACRDGSFREDLYYRLNVVPLRMPALRDRRDDIPLLAQHFLNRFRDEMQSEVERLSPAAMERLVAYDWPGNVRQLENVIERSVVLARGKTIDAPDLRLDWSRPARPREISFLPQGMTLEEHEQSLIREALKRAEGNKSKAARLLGMTRNALRYRLSQMGID